MLLLLGCAHLVDISVTHATIAPQMANGASWDGPDRVAPEVGGLFSTMVNAVDPSGRLSREASDTVAQKAAPDAFGTATLLCEGERNGESQALVLASEDTIAPDWTSAPASFANVKLTGDVRVRVALTDDDLVTDDPIGTVELSNADLSRALHDGSAEVDVSKQSSGQLRTVTVKVVKRQR